MLEVEDLPQMVSLSPEPVTAVQNDDTITKDVPDHRSQNGRRRHNWDAEAIEVLWRQDCDLGLTRHDFAPIRSWSEEDVPEKVPRLDEEWCQEACKLEGATATASEDTLDDIWAGLDYTIDLETGEYVLRMPPSQSTAPATVTSTTDAARVAATGVSAGNPGAEESALFPAPIPTTIDDLVTRDRRSPVPRTQISESPTGRVRRLTHSSDSGLESIDSDSSAQTETHLNRITQIVDTSQTGAIKLNDGGGCVRQRARPLQRMVSVEQRWQDLVSVLRLPEQSSGGAASPSPATTVAAPPAALPSPQTARTATPVAATATLSPPAPSTVPSPALRTTAAVKTRHSLSVMPPSTDRESTEDVQQLEPMHSQQIQPTQMEQSTFPHRNSQPYANNSTVGSYVSQVSSPAAAEPCVPTSVTDSGAGQYYQLTPLVAAPADEAPPSLDQDITFLSQLLGVDDIDMQEYWAPMPVESTANAVSPAERQSSPIPQLQELGAMTTSAQAPSAGGSAHTPNTHQPPVAQKKHHLFGKRINNAPQNNDETSSHDQSPPGDDRHHHHPQQGHLQPRTASPARQRYGSEAGGGGGGTGAGFSTSPYPHVPAPDEAASLVIDIGDDKLAGTEQLSAALTRREEAPVAHNHSYHQPGAAQGSISPRRPVARDKVERSRGERLSRDERRTREMNIPMTADEIVHLPMEEFNERLSKLQLSEAQLSLIKDVRRRGKNKLAAQNCRKRKLDQIQSLAEDVQRVRDQRQRDLEANSDLARQRSRIRDKYAQLHRHIFQSLRDEEGRPYSSTQYSLQLSADGDVLLVPRNTARGAAFVPPSGPSGNVGNTQIK